MSKFQVQIDGGGAGEDLGPELIDKFLWIRGILFSLPPVGSGIGWDKAHVRGKEM